MALSWIPAAVAVFMIVGNGVTALDPSQLEPIVQEILTRYTPNYSQNKSIPPMFSVAVSVPYNNNKYDMSKVPDSGKAVKNIILKCKVYKSQKVVAATVLKWPNVLKQCPDDPVPWKDVLESCGENIKSWADIKTEKKIEFVKDKADHAEYRTLENFNTLVPSTDLMVLYTRASSCESVCTNPTNPGNILKSIKQIKKWNNYAVVFSDVFKCKRSSEKSPCDSLQRLGNSVGLENIFRCSPGQEVKCINCFKDNGVAHACVSDDSKTDSKKTGGRGIKDHVQQGKRRVTEHEGKWEEEE